MEICPKNPNVWQSDKNMGISHDDVSRFVVAIRALFTSKWYRDVRIAEEV